MDLPFQALIEFSEDIVTVVDAHGKILYDNPAVERLLGYRQGELVGRNAFELVHGDDLSTAFSLMVETVAHPGSSATLTYRFQHRDGSWRWLASAGRVVSSPSGLRLVITSRRVEERPEGIVERGTGAVAAERDDGVVRALETVHLEMLQRLALAAEFRDDDTGQHTRRVGELSAALAAALGLPALDVEQIRHAAPLHDVGKIGIRDSILLKPGPLSTEELEIMRTHTILGARLLSRGRADTVRAAESIALHHHERWDGRGYPAGLEGEAIPLPARIVAVVDFYDALTHDRPYRPAWPRAEVLRAIRKEMGTHFDPHVAEAFLEILGNADRRRSERNEGSVARGSRLSRRMRPAADPSVVPPSS